MSKHHKKTDVAELVGPLLKRLKLAKERVPENSENIIDQISKEVEKTKDILDSKEKLEWELAGCLGKIERQIDPWIDLKPREKASDLLPKPTITEVGESSNTSYEIKNADAQIKEFRALLNSSDPFSREFLEMFGIFPENTELKKRLVIYWWRALLRAGIKHSERMFSILVDKKILIPVHREHNKVIDRFTIEPIFHKRLISYCRRYSSVNSEKREEGTWRFYRHWLLLNLDQNYLNSRDVMDISSEYFLLHVVQLGSWRCTKREVHNRVEKTGSEETKLKDHIEVDQINFLKKLGIFVSYLSLQGISGIEELDESIGKLKWLEILDLRACHNLQKLPKKPRSTLIQKLIKWDFSKESWWFEELTVLDMSECYLLDHMPKWICELSWLEVLKGFVVGSLRNKSQSCQISDLSKLNYLTKLSIRIAPGILDPEVFRGFNSLRRLLVLTIIWGENKEIPTYSLPENLNKLDIRGYPEADTSKLENPGELVKLKRLYVRGGNLTKIPCHEKWKVEILRLRFLEKLVYPTNWDQLRSSFKNLQYVEYVECPKPENFPNYGNSWRKCRISSWFKCYGDLKPFH